MSLQGVDDRTRSEGEAAGRPASRPRPDGGIGRLARGLWSDFRAVHIRLLIVRLFLSPVPDDLGGRLRARLLRLAGLRFGAGTVLAGTPQISGGRDLERQLTVGRNCWFNIQCVLEVHADITIGNRVQFGQQVMVLTNTHEMGPSFRRAGPLKALPVRVGDGTWLGARSVILPGVTIGAGSVVAAGAVVTKDVPSNTLVAGVPAKPVRQLDSD